MTACILNKNATSSSLRAHKHLFPEIKLHCWAKEERQTLFLNGNHRGTESSKKNEKESKYHTHFAIENKYSKSFPVTVRLVQLGNTHINEH